MTVIAMFNATEFLVFGLVIAFMLFLTGLWLWALVHCARRIAAGETRLVGWLIVICVTHVLGTIAYFLFGRERTQGTPLNGAHSA